MTPRVRAIAILIAVVAAATLSAPAAARDVVLPATGEAALAQPMVVLMLGDRPGGARQSRSDDLADLLESMPAVAILDTRASGHVLSAATAARFDVEAE